MACLLPRSCTPSVPSTATARDPTKKSAKSGSVAPLKPLLTVRFFASSAMQLRNTMRPHSTPASEQWKGRQIEYQPRSSASSDGIKKELARKGAASTQPGKGRSGDRDWTRGKILCHNKAESEVQPCANSFTGTTASYSQSIHQLPSLQ